MRFLSIAQTTLTSLLLLFAAEATASNGQVGMVVSKQAISAFSQVSTTELFQARPKYIGSTNNWHLFMVVVTHQTSAGPYNHLRTYKIARDALTVQHGWRIQFFDRYITPNQCPSFQNILDKSNKIKISPAATTRSRCGTG